MWRHKGRGGTEGQWALLGAPTTKWNLVFQPTAEREAGEVTGEQMGGDQEEGADGYGVLLGVCVLRGWLVVEPLVLLK